jgi:hypothetical protein
VENNFEIGTLVVDDRGFLVLLSQEGLQTGEMQGNGVVPRYYEGFTIPHIARWKGTVMRRVGHISDLVKILAQTADIKTPADKDESELTERELLAKVLRDNAELKKQVAQFTAVK